MKSDIVRFFGFQRQIFGVCPKCQDFFRLSDCKIYIKKKPLADWMDKITLEEDRLDGLEELVRSDQGKPLSLWDNPNKKGVLFRLRVAILASKLP